MVSQVTKYIAAATFLGGSVFLAKEYFSDGRRVKKTYTRPSNTLGAISNESPKSVPGNDIINNMWNSRDDEDDQLYNGYVTKMKKWIPGSK